MAQHSPRWICVSLRYEKAGNMPVFRFSTTDAMGFVRELLRRFFEWGSNGLRFEVHGRWIFSSIRQTIIHCVWGRGDDMKRISDCGPVRRAVNEVLKIILYSIALFATAFSLMMAVHGEWSYSRFFRIGIFTFSLIASIESYERLNGSSAQSGGVGSSSSRGRFRSRSSASRPSTRRAKRFSSAVEAYSHLNERAGEVFFQCPSCHHYNALYDVGDPHKRLPSTIRCSSCRRKVRIVE